MRVVATAGHVDHGKSTLVLALTGSDPDRLSEEKTRGLTIDLGFAFCDLPSGLQVGFVDVPGHERFVKNMLAGVGAVDIAMLVVAANEGWKPQTSEHAQILDLLGIGRGVVALTKVALVDAGTLERLRLELAERVGWPVVAVDAPTGRGLDELRAALDRVLRRAPGPRDVGRPRLWIDRVFGVKGAGTVVTGTLTGGQFGRGDEVVVEPGARRARIRRIESNHVRHERIAPGGRVALNLAGIDHADVQRGMAVVAPDQWVLAGTLDVSVRAVAGGALRRRSTVDAHIGTGEQTAQLRLLDDEERFARLRLTTPLPLAPGDRIVLRSSAAQATIGGAEVLDVAPVARTADAVARLGRPLAERVLDARPWCTRAEMARLAGDEHAADGYAIVIGDWLTAPDTVATMRAHAAELVRAGPTPLSTVAASCGIDVVRLRGCLADDPDLAIEADLVSGPRGDALTDDPRSRSFLAALDASPLAPPLPADLGVPRSVVRALVREGVAVDIHGVVFASHALDDARARIARLVLDRGAVTIADVRTALGTTRRYALAIVDRMDAEGVTRRRGDVRIAGPGARRP